MSADPIAIFDSGIGGLSVLRHLQRLLPHEQLLYLADQRHVPYGARHAEEICRFCRGITRFFLTQQAKIIVIACNTATGVALTHLRTTFPGALFVGMEPAVKPAAAQTHNGKVGVLATPGTFASQRYADLMQRYAQNISVWEDPCPGLVQQIEKGAIDTPETEQLLRRHLLPMLAKGVDTIVLGCTHYPFVQPLINGILAEAAAAVVLIDPAPAVARQTQRLLQERNLLTSSEAAGNVTLLTTGSAANLSQQAKHLLGQALEGQTAVWQNQYRLLRK